LAEVSSPTVLKQIETLFGVGTLIGLPDGALLDRFIGGSVEDSEAAFLALVERHGPMVLQVCRQILGNSHDAEDASQATFLILARKARTIRRMDSVASWLYGVASRIAARARVDAARRRKHERRSMEMEKAMAMKLVDQGDRSETWPELYEELGRLPERLRLPIVLFHLKGLSYEQMARQFGCPVRTVQSRLARARQRLRSRLARRGVGPAGILLAAALVPDAVSAAVSTAWKQSTVKAAVHYMTGGASTATVPAAVVALAEGALRAMILNRLKSAAMVAILVGVVAGGAGVLARPSPPNPLARGDQPVPEPRDERYRVNYPIAEARGLDLY
jgi:RNA polymerase sigma factor (sigma-70 family)